MKRLFDDYQVCAFEYGVTHAYVDGSNLSIAVSIDAVLYLHSFKDNHQITLLHGVAHIDLHVKDNTWQG